MASVGYKQHLVDLHVNVAHPPEDNSNIAIGPGATFDRFVQIPGLGNARINGFWWSVPSYNNNFRGCFGAAAADELAITSVGNGRVQIRGKAADGGASARVSVWLHVMYSSDELNITDEE